MFRIALIFIAALVIFVILRLSLRKSSLSLQQFFSLYLAICAGIVLIYLGLTGRLHWLFVLLGGALPLLSGIITYGMRLVGAVNLYRTMKQWFGLPGGAPSPGKQSRIQTDFLDMTLDHDSGSLSGTVLQGRWKGSQLVDLSLDDLISLLQEVSTDPDSVNVLMAYLDRTHSDWQSHAEAGDQQHSTSSTSSDMNEQEALEILGLEPGADVDDIKQAHRRLIQKLHPDRGGSTYLASRINEAKDLLLKIRG